MFTGIITDLGSVRAIDKDGDTRLRINTAFDTAGLDLGASVCCAGVCLTVTGRDSGWFEVMVSEETLSRSTLGSWRRGTAVNLERALRLGDELGGHLVSGHVDGTGQIAAVTPDGESLCLEVEVSGDLAPFIAAKGSVTLDGVSLTVNEVTGAEAKAKKGARFGVNIIPHTQEATTLGRLSPGDTVNVEIDMLARYVARLLNRP